jgi:AMP nucleosidase
MQTDQNLPILTPTHPEPQSFMDAAAAVAHLEALYTQATEFLAHHFNAITSKGKPAARVRAFYPEIRLTVTSFANTDSRLSFGHVASPGTYATTITRPDLFRNYLTQQLSLLIQHHSVPVTIAYSDTPIPVHFAVAGNPNVSVPQEGVLEFSLRDVFDVPDLATTNDDIVNGTRTHNPDGSQPLAPFTAQRVDYSLARLSHYTATDASHFQNYVLFTNYQFYVDEFEAIARAALGDKSLGYTEFVTGGNASITAPDQEIRASGKTPQMPTYHLKRADGDGITLVNIGVGPSNAKTATDHIAVLRPHAWLMVGHCAGLRNSQSLGDFCLAHAYLREDHVLDDDLPIWVPIPALAEIQIALQQAVA